MPGGAGRGAVAAVMPQWPADAAHMTLSKPLAIVVAAAAVAVVWTIDHALGPNVSVLLFHLAPVLLATWFAGPTWGVVFAVIIAALAFVGPPGQWGIRVPPDPQLIEAGSDLAATLLIVWMQSKLRDVYQHAHDQARCDSLTGVLNRNGLREPLQREIERAKRYGRPFSLLYLDCDNFKAVNDGLGHHAGDAVLIAVGSVLRDGVRSADAVARVGGDEFVALLSEAGANDGRATARHLKHALDTAMTERSFGVTFSIGVVTFGGAPDDVEQALAQADSAMYDAKNGGKDNITCRQL